MIKYLITYKIEKLHRYCFSVIYQQKHRTTRIDKIFILLLNICAYLVPDYREYLRKWHEDKKSYYLKYKTYNW